MTLGVRSLRILAALVAVASVAVVAASVVVVKQSNRIDSVQRRIGAGTIEQVAWEADRDPDNRHFALTSADRKERIEGVLTQKNVGFLLSTTAADAGSDKVYQLWAETPAGVVSLGIIGEDFSKPMALRVPEGAQNLFVTEEAATGAPVPSTARLVSGPVPAWS